MLMGNLLKKQFRIYRICLLYTSACEDKKRIATRAKALNLDAIHDTVHEMCKDEARHGKDVYKRQAR